MNAFYSHELLNASMSSCDKLTCSCRYCSLILISLLTMTYTTGLILSGTRWLSNCCAFVTKAKKAKKLESESEI